MPIRAMRMRKTAVASLIKAVYNAAKKPSAVTLSAGNTIATWASSSDAFQLLEFFRTTGKYWVEIGIGASGNNVDFHAVAMANNSADVNTYAGAGTNGKDIFEGSTRGTWGYDYGGSGGTIVTGAIQVINSARLCIYINVDTRKFFLYVHNGTTGQWIGDNPNITPTGGQDFQFSGAAAPAYQSYHSGTSGEVIAVGSMLHAAQAPVGTTLGWDNAP